MYNLKMGCPNLPLLRHNPGGAFLASPWRLGKTHVINLAYTAHLVIY